MNKKNNYFSDSEYRILLAALGRERKICEKVDKERGSDSKLVEILDTITRKIKDIQYQNNN